MKDNHTRPVEVARTIDGDTFVGTMYLIGQEIQLHNQHFRLIGVDTPERGEPGYNEATAFTAGILREAIVDVTVHGRDSFGRWLVEVYTPHADRTLNENLLIRGLAVPFEG